MRESEEEKKREGKGNPTSIRREGDGQIYFSCLENNGNSKRRQSFTYDLTVITNLCLFN